MTLAQLKNPEAIVTSDWLETHIHEPNLRIFDCTTTLVHEVNSPHPYRVVSGRKEFEIGHIPGSAYLDLQADFSDSNSRWAMKLPTVAELTTAFELAGIGDNTRVILYSRNSVSWATRFWWMLRWLGFDNAAILEGGFNKWEKEGRMISILASHYLPGKLTVSPRTNIFVDREDVLSAIEDKNTCIISALGPDVHSGENPRYGRPGRIPSSVNVPQVSLVNADTLEFHPAITIKKMFAAVCAETDKLIITYCGSGIFATVNAFLLYQLGYENVTVYDNSMSEWGRDASLPIEMGSNQ